jgi:hypothetical protein
MAKIDKKSIQEIQSHIKETNTGLKSIKEILAEQKEQDTSMSNVEVSDKSSKKVELAPSSIKQIKPKENIWQEQKENEKIQKEEKQVSLLEDIKGGTLKMVDSLKDMADKMKNTLLGGLGIAAGLILAPIVGLAGFLEGLKDGVKLLNKITGKGLEKIVKPFISFFRNIKMFFSKFREIKIIKTIVPYIDEAVKLVKSIIKPVINTFKAIINFGKTILSPITNAFKAISGMLRTSEAFMGPLRSILSFAKGFGRVLGKIFLPITIAISAFDFITGFVKGFKEDGLVAGLKSGFTKMIDGLFFAPLRAIDGLINWVGSVFGIDKITKPIKDAFGFLWSTIKTIFSNLFNFEFPDIVGFVKSSISNLWIKIKSLFSFDFELPKFNILGFIKEKGTLLLNKIKSLFSFDFEMPTLNLYQLAYDVGSGIFNKILKIFDFNFELPKIDLMSWLKDLATGAFDKLKSLFGFDGDKKDIEGKLNRDSLSDKGYLDKNLLTKDKVEVKKLKQDYKSGKISKVEYKEIVTALDEQGFLNQKQRKELANTKRVETNSSLVTKSSDRIYNTDSYFNAQTTQTDFITRQPKQKPEIVQDKKMSRTSNNIQANTLRNKRQEKQREQQVNNNTAINTANNYLQSPDMRTNTDDSSLNQKVQVGI